MNNEPRCATCAHVTSKELFTGGSEYRCTHPLAGYSPMSGTPRKVRAKGICNSYKPQKQD